MVTVAPIPTSTGQPPMTTELLTLAQWLSPAYPLGSFAYSHGLETATAERWVTDKDSLRDWLTNVLEHGSGRSDAIWLRLGHAAPDAKALLALDAEARAFAASSERVTESARQGAAFAQVTGAIGGQDLPAVQFPLIVGFAASRHGIAPTPAAALYLQALVTNLTSAAQRLMPLGQTAAQTIVASLHPLCLSMAEKTAGSAIDDIGSTAFLSDIASLRHETLEPRIFQT